VLYDDGEREAMLLASEKLKWLLPPEVQLPLCHVPWHLDSKPDIWP
jgi:hypothetical protein